MRRRADHRVQNRRRRRLGRRTKDCLFRAAQECVSNAIRHGNASRVDIRLDTDATAIRLQVLDNGLGSTEGVGAGLAGMRTRAALLCGDVTITRDPGWTVAITLPLRTRAHSPAAPLQAGAHDGVVFDHQDFHAPAACTSSWSP